MRAKKSGPPLNVRCPACHKKVKWGENPYRPFCSKRCQITDLGGWAAEKHRIAGEKASPEDIKAQKEKKSHKS